MGTGAIATVLLLAFAVSLVVGRCWIALNPPLLAVAWWIFRYVTAGFPDAAAGRHGAATAIVGTLIAEAGVAVGLVVHRAASRFSRRMPY